MKTKMFIRLLLIIELLILSSISFTGCLFHFLYSIATTPPDSDYELYEPKIKHGEFKFKIVYELNEETFTVEDTIVCDFNKVCWNWNIGYYLQFDSFLKSTGKKGIFIDKISKNDHEYDDIYIYLGDGDFYLNNDSDKKIFTPFLSVLSNDTWQGTTDYPNFETDYRFNIISFEHDSPIVNNYPNIPAEEYKNSFVFIKSAFELEKGDELDLTLNLFNHSILIKSADLKFVSSDNNIATVDEEGVVYGISEGTVTITMTSHDGKGVNDFCTVIVKN